MMHMEALKQVKQTRTYGVVRDTDSYFCDLLISLIC